MSEVVVLLYPILEIQALCWPSSIKCQEILYCVLYFRKPKKVHWLTGHNNGGKSLIHSQPFTLSKQTRTSLLLIPSVTHTHTHFLSPTLYSFPHTMGPCQIAELFQGLTGRHKSPYTPAPKHSGQVICHTSLDERENTDKTWAALFWKWEKDTET